jgi:predicted MFS family arabinose efflux permease
MSENAPATPLFSYPFVSLCLVALFGFGNIAVFYGLYPYLISIGITPFWAGWILALEPLAALVLRPVISPCLGPGNALPVMRASLVMIALALLGYAWARSLPALICLRVFHGAAFVTLVSATTALLVHFIPPSKSGQGFGLFSLTTMLPFAVMPPLMEYLLRVVPDAGHAYAWVSLMTLPALALLAPLGPHARQAQENEKSFSGRASTGLADIRSALENSGVALVLGAGLLTFLGSTLLFFFMKDFGASIGLANAGLFFTVSTGATIAVRLFGSSRFDRLDKRRTLMLAYLVLAGCYASYSLVASPLPFLLAAGLFGACMGVAMPLLQSTLFHLADPSKRGLTANLMLSTMDAGYVLGPYLGGMMLGMGLSHAALFRLSALLALGAWLLIRQTGQPSPATLNPSHGRTP